MFAVRTRRICCRLVELHLPSNGNTFVRLHCILNLVKLKIVGANCSQLANWVTSLLFLIDRYVHYLTGLLSGAIRINSNPIYLHQLVISGLPEYEDKAAQCHVFVKIYQNMQPVYVSGIWYSFIQHSDAS